MQSKRVSDFVGRCVGHVFFNVRDELLREDKARRIGVPVECAYIGDTSRIGGVPARRTDNHADAVMDTIGVSKRVYTGVLRRDVDVEGDVILRNALPDVLDASPLRGVESRRVPVEIKR